MKTNIIAFAGKGGVGKTSISAITVRLLKEKYPNKKILAIDADPAVGLATALGVDVCSTVDDIRKLFIENVNNGDTKVAVEMLGEAKFRIFDALIEKDNVSFLAIGRPESAGCYCKVNAYLKEVISMVAEAFDYVVIDGEAGIEQVNRRVMEKVTHLILVSDASKKGLNVTKTILDVAKELTMFEKAGLILNRIIDMSYLKNIDTHGIELLSAISDDREMVKSDFEGNTVYSLPVDAPILEGTKIALEKLKIL